MLYHCVCCIIVCVVLLCLLCCWRGSQVMMDDHVSVWCPLMFWYDPNKCRCSYIHNNRLWAGWVLYRPHIGNVDQGMFVRNMLTYYSCWSNCSVWMPKTIRNSDVYGSVDPNNVLMLELRLGIFLNFFKFIFCMCI